VRAGQESAKLEQRQAAGQRADFGDTGEGEIAGADGEGDGRAAPLLHGGGPVVMPPAGEGGDEPADAFKARAVPWHEARRGGGGGEPAVAVWLPTARELAVMG
jgi:hypothetical protein